MHKVALKDEHYAVKNEQDALKDAQDELKDASVHNGARFKNKLMGVMVSF
jgi:hypothetical protein